MLTRAGVGLRLPHLEEEVAGRPSAGWLEIHPENFVASPHATELLLELAADYPISVHTAGVSVGSAHGIDRAHLVRVRRLVGRRGRRGRPSAPGGIGPASMAFPLYRSRVVQPDHVSHACQQ